MSSLYVSSWHVTDFSIIEALLTRRVPSSRAIRLGFRVQDKVKVVLMKYVNTGNMTMVMLL